MALGAGLDAVFADNALDSSEVTTLRVTEIEPNKSQPRKSFDENSIRELADSIKEHGLIQPIIVRPTGNGLTYQIVAGERRWRACRILKMNDIPVIIKELSDVEVAQISIIENIQRSDLNPVEEAYAYRELMDKYEMTQEKLSEAVGKSRSYIANALRLISLPANALNALCEGNITVGHAKALLSLEEDELIEDTLENVLKDDLNVRQTEKLLKALKNGEKKEKEKSVLENVVSNHYSEVEIQMRESIGRKVSIKGSAEWKGSLTIEFYDKEDLNNIAEGLIEMLETDNE